jgi:hypothetical protein
MRLSICLIPVVIAFSAIPVLAGAAPTPASTASALSAAQPPAAAVPAGAELNPKEILDRTVAALKSAGNIKANVALEVWYPTHYTSVIDLYASPSGQERADLTTTVNADRFKSVEVISGRIVWCEQDSPVGKLVTKIDLEMIQKELAKDKNSFAALPGMGTSTLFDVASLSDLVDFNKAVESTFDGRKAFLLSGVLAAKYAEGKASLPAGAADWYKTAVLYVGEDYMPLRIELGQHGDMPYARVDFTTIEKNVTVPAGAFDYTPPENAEVVDNTQWALSELKGK